MRVELLRGSNYITSLPNSEQSLISQIAKPRPDMNIKVAAFTVTQKLNFTDYLNLKLLLFCRYNTSFKV